MSAETHDCEDGNTSKEKKYNEEKIIDYENTMTRDDLLRKELGEVGWFQLRYALLLTIPVLFSGIRNDYILSAAAIPHRCLIPECGESSKLQVFKPDWILNAVPESKSGLSSCSRYAANDHGVNGTLDFCPISLFDHTDIVDCEQFVYANDYTVVYDFDLGCQEWLRASAGTVGNVGLLLGLPLTGFISDRYGRKVALVFNICSLGFVGMVRAFSVNYSMYMAMQLAQTAFGSSIYGTALILATELLGPKYRFIGVTIMSMYSLGQVMLGAVYWLIGSWRYATLALCIPCLLMVVYYWLITESIRWLLVKKKYAEARKIIETVGRVNKRTISDTSMEALLNPIDAPSAHSRGKAGMIRTLIRSRILLRRVCIVPVWWIAGTFVYYGLSINSTGLSDTMYLNYILASAVGIPGCFIGAFLMHNVGRKFTLCSGFLFSAFCNIIFVFMPTGSMYTIRLITYLLGKVSVSVAMSTVYLYTSELYPTEYRHTLLAFSSTVGRLGAIAAPLTPVFKQYWHGLPSVMFGSMGLLAGMLAFTQPETLGTKLPDTFAEAELLGSPAPSAKSKPRPDFKR